MSEPSAGPDWSERYRHYVEGSMRRATRAQDLNREVLRRLTTGELAAWTLDTQLTFFVATHAAAYSQRVAKLTADFLTGMIQMGSIYSHELIERILPGAISRPDTTSVPQFDPAASTDWLSDLVRFATDENSRALSRLRMVMDKVASGELVPSQVQNISTQFQSERAWESTTHLVELFFNLLSGLEDVHSSFNEEYLRTVLGMAPGETTEPTEPSGLAQPAGPAGPAESPRVESVRLEVALGEPASIRFAVTNTEPEPVAVRCELSGVRRADGVGPAFDPLVTTDPEYLELAPAAEATVALTVHTDAEHFQPGTRYEALFRVANDTRRLLELPLDLEVTAARQSPDGEAGETETE
jgi:hypothetical protein